MSEGNQRGDDPVERLKNQSLIERLTEKVAHLEEANRLLRIQSVSSGELAERLPSVLDAARVDRFIATSS